MLELFTITVFIYNSGNIIGGFTSLIHAKCTYSCTQCFQRNDV